VVATGPPRRIEGATVSSSSRLAAVLASAALLGGGSLGFTAVEPTSVVGHIERDFGAGLAVDLCAEGDLVETGLQGEVPLADQLSGRAAQGYNCGIDLVGHVSLGYDYGANMAWVDHCAYVATAGSGVAVIDVSNPSDPVVATILTGPGSDFTLETLGASQEAKLLATGRYGPAPLGVGGPMDLWDVADCTAPVLVSTFTWPTNTHNLTFSPDGTRLWSTLPLQVIDVSDPAAPVFLGNIEDDLKAAAATPEQRFADEFLSHEAWVSDDGNTLYVGGQTPAWDTFSILDVTDYPAQPVRIISQQQGRGHSVRTATIDGVPYVLHSEESIADPTAKGCVPADANPMGGPAQPYLTDISDPTAPRMQVSQFRLEINEVENCPLQVADNMNSSVHYHDVDDQADTTFAMLSMWNSGLRIADLRDPANPTEVAYFNPGMFEFIGGAPGRLDVAWGHVRYVAETGHIWLATGHGGFWVLALQPQVREHLGLEPVADGLARTIDRDGSAPAVVRPPATQVPIGRNPSSAWYCTLDLGLLSADRLASAGI